MKAMNIFVNNVGHAKEANNFIVNYFLMDGTDVESTNLQCCRNCRNSNAILLSKSYKDFAMTCIKTNKKIFLALLLQVTWGFCLFVSCFACFSALHSLWDLTSLTRD